ncbi:MAG: hypothetical protein HQM10_17860 [Candidatus Riflebacteria bacterium]|nr:hypothetical protein [Candidatus Riflebacteria bacterium]
MKSKILCILFFLLSSTLINEKHLFACEGFNHNWIPLCASSSSCIDEEISRIYLNTLSSRLDKAASGVWEIAAFEGSEGNSDFLSILKNEISLLSKSKQLNGTDSAEFSWNNDLGLMETDKLASSTVGGVWVTFTDTFIRSGVSFDSVITTQFFLRIFFEGKAKARTLAALKNGKVALIDEISLYYVSEMDFSMTFSPTFGGMLLRRAARICSPMIQSAEVIFIPIPGLLSQMKPASSTVAPNLPDTDEKKLQ